MIEHGPWKTLKSHTAYDCPWIRLDVSDVITPGGSPGQYHVVHFHNLAIGIIPVDSDGNVWLVGQYRYPLKRYSWEIPEGGGDPEVDPLESAKRELKEETGLTAARWERVLEAHLSNSATDEWGVLYLATDLTVGDAEPEEDEDLRLRKISIDDFYQEVMDGKITDSLTVMAAQFLMIRKLNKPH
jgi:8-oxo-dGTP pyrophosphatase MutT (NUDIX family)